MYCSCGDACSHDLEERLHAIVFDCCSTRVDHFCFMLAHCKTQPTSTYLGGFLEERNNRTSEFGGALDHDVDLLEVVEQFLVVGRAHLVAVDEVAVEVEQLHVALSHASPATDTH